MVVVVLLATVVQMAQRTQVVAVAVQTHQVRVAVVAVV
jgi:hypothetical protein